jgi:proteasome lid subunit RPN8/RPN11
MDDRDDRKAVTIGADLLARIYAHARAEFPAECCGYLVGSRGGSVVDEQVACTNAVASEAIAPDRDADTSFAIAGAELLAFAKTFDSPRPALVVYHSHTNGRAYFSRLDRAFACAAEGPVYPVQHVVVGVTADGPTECVQLAWSVEARDYVEVARWSAC